VVQRYGRAVRPTRTHAKKEPPLNKDPLAVMPEQKEGGRVFVFVTPLIFVVIFWEQIIVRATPPLTSCTVLTE
jgi:hypothetical protein